MGSTWHAEPRAKPRGNREYDTANLTAKASPLTKTGHMSKRARGWPHTVAALALIAVCWLTVPPDVSTRSQMPAAAAGGEAVTRGEAWFFQRCSLCHVGRVVKDTNYEPMAPSLEGVLKDASPDREEAVLGQIQRGSLRMPGFRYNFTPSELEELMAYLKTL